MANNYTLFANALEIDTPEQYAWLMRQLEEVELVMLPDNKVGIVTVQEGSPPDMIEKFECEFGCFRRFMAEAYAYADLKVAAPSMCDYKINSDGAKGQPFTSGSILFYSEDSHDVEPAARLVQMFLKKFGQPGESWKCGMALTCDKSRDGEFGGAAGFVTADKICWTSTYAWLDDQEYRYSHLGDHSHWVDHPDPELSSEEWRREVGCDDTRLGYHDWVLHKIEAREADGDAEEGEV